MPQDYGGEAPTIKELDQQNHEMIEKYAKWLKESEYFKTDETKRAKKASWWGIFSNSNPTQAQLEKEKDILKNLQID